MRFPFLVLGLLLCLLPASIAETDATQKFTRKSPPAADGTEWEPIVDFDTQIFPSYLIATANMPDDEEEEIDETVLGDPTGIIGIAITVPKPNTRIKVTVKANKLMDASTWEGVIPKAKEEYWVSPKISYHFDALRAVKQQTPMSINIMVELPNLSPETRTITANVHSINDCPFGVALSEDMGSEDEGYRDLGWMFAAYVNESHPWIDKVLKDALKIGIVSSFDGYQSEDEDVVMAQVYAIWDVFHRRGVKYSSILTTPGGSQLVYSQHVRFLEECSSNNQANCVDGSVLFASILRKIGITPVLIGLPDHMYVGFYLDEEQNNFVALETTLIGSDELEETDCVDDMISKLPKGKRKFASLKSFASAIEAGNEDYKEHEDDFAQETPDYQLIDVDAARDDGVMPIPYLEN